MISMMMFLLSLFAGKQMQDHPVDSIQHNILSVSALADGMNYYQTQAIQQCWDNGVSKCPVGSVSLHSRSGATESMSYKAGYETVTDGTHYIMTTLDANGIVSGRSTADSNLNAGIFATLKMMTKGSTSVGYYDKTVGGVVLPDQENAVVQANFQNPPVQGQPVLYT